MVAWRRQCIHQCIFPSVWKRPIQCGRIYVTTSILAGISRSFLHYLSTPINLEFVQTYNYDDCAVQCIDIQHVHVSLKIKNVD